MFGIVGPSIGTLVQLDLSEPFWNPLLSVSVSASTKCSANLIEMPSEEEWRGACDQREAHEYDKYSLNMIRVR